MRGATQAQHSMTLQKTLIIVLPYICCDLKTMSNIFCGWKQKPLFSCVEDDVEVVLLYGCKKFNYLFFYFWLCLLFCRLLSSDLGELVLVIKRNPWCAIDNLDGECESQFLETIGAELSKEWKEVNKEQLYEVGWREGEAGNFLLGNGRRKVPILFVRNYGVCLDFDSN
jgi:hypothetical protein